MTTAPTTTAPARPLLRYHGGKALLAPWIVAQMPRHAVYVEPFGGAASVLLAKPRSAVEIYNDLDARLVNLFRVLREAPDALANAVCLTLYSRREYEISHTPCPHDAVEDARRFVVCSQMGIGVDRQGARTGFRAWGRPDKRLAWEWADMPAVVRRVAERLRGVLVEEGDGVAVMVRYDAPDVLHYVDPPYVQTTRGKNRYAHDLDDAGHERLVACLRGLSGAVMLSGYDSALYREELPGWHVVSVQARAGDATARTECLWLNPRAAAARPTLFDAPAEVAA